LAEIIIFYIDNLFLQVTKITEAKPALVTIYDYYNTDDKYDHYQLHVNIYCFLQNIQN
jgi:hypothetical protein